MTGLAFDLARISEELEAGAAVGVETPWFAASLAEPAVFERDLLAFAGRRLGARFAAPGAALTLWSELLPSGDGALAFIGRNGARVALGRASLERGSSALATEWARAGVGAAASVVLLTPPGPELLLGLFAALRLGAIAVWVPVDGPRLASERLLRLASPFVAAGPAHERLAGAQGAVVLPLTPSERTPPHAAPPYPFEPSDVALAVLSPFASEELPPVFVSAAQLRLAVLRDGQLLWPLSRGARLAAPAVDPRSVWPALPLAVLRAGAVFAEVEGAFGPEGVPRWPALLDLLREVGPTDLLLPSSTLPPAELLVALRGARRVARSLAEPHDGECWETALTALDDGRLAIGAVLPTPGCGGLALFSPFRRQDAATRRRAPSVLPAPGSGALVAEAGTLDQPTAGPTGVFRPLGVAAEAVGDFVLSATTNGAPTCYGPLGLGRGGRSAPLGTIERAAEAEPGVRGAVAVQQAGGTLGAGTVTLVAFIAVDDPVGPARREAAARARVAAEVGAEGRIDKCSVFPLEPRRDEGGAVDRAWAERSLRDGSLRRRTRDSLLLTLARIERLLHRSPPCPPS